MTSYNLIRALRVSLLFSCAAPLLLITGCDKVPTFGELMGNEKPPETVAPAPVEAPPPPQIEAPVVKAPPPKTPEMIYEEFLAVDKQQRSNKHLKEISELDAELRSQVHELDMGYSQLTDEGAPYLLGFPELEVLDISFTGITNVGLHDVGGLRKLKSLSMAKLPLGSAGLQEVANLSQIEYLDLGQTALNDKSFEYLLGMKNLQVLKIGDMSNLQGQGLAELARQGVLRNLRELVAPNTSIGNYGLEGLKQMPMLEILYLPRAGVNDSHMPLIGTRGELKRLSLEGNSVSSAGVKHLVKLKNLEGLSLLGCVAVNDDAFNFIKTMKNLQTLNVSGTSVTEKAVITLKEKFLPDVVIYYNNIEY